MRLPLTALVVDDDNDVIEAIGMVLESTGYHVLSAATAGECRELLVVQQPDIVILDVMLETFTEGLNIYADIREDPRYDRIPVILLSAIDHDMGFEVALPDDRGDLFLEKPVDPAVLLASMSRLLEPEHH